MVIRIGIDIDEVLTPTNDYFLSWFNKKYGTSVIKEDITEYKFSQFVDFDADFVVDKINKFLLGNMHVFELYEGALDVLTKWKKEGYELVVLTSRSLNLKDVTLDWLDKHFGEGFFDEVLLYNRGTSEDVCKSIVCENNNIDIMIEDAPHYIESIIKSKISVLIMDQPWNRDIKDNEYAKRVFSWDEIFEELDKLLSTTLLTKVA